MKTGKITLFKKTEINNEVIYFVVDETGWCMGNSTDYDEADKIYNLCVGNRAKGLPTEEILKQSTALIGEHYTANEEVDKMVSERLRKELSKFVDFINDEYCDGNIGNMLDIEDVVKYLKR